MHRTTGPAPKRFGPAGLYYWSIKCVITTINELINKIADDQKRRELTDDTAIPINVFNPRQEIQKNLSTENGNFMWFQLFVEVLLRMSKYYTQLSSTEFVKICKQQYRENDVQLAKIDEFEKTYTPSRSIWYYTKELFLYRILNLALRKQDMDTLFTYTFFIRDLYQQLLAEKNFDEPILRVYRGQAIDVEEIDKLITSQNQYISFNNFLSTSRDRDTALGFALSADVTENRQSVLFEIEANTHLNNAKPFADISRLSCFQNEEEVLFMLGSVFQLTNINYNEQQQVWLIKLVLCDEDDDQLKDVFDSMKEDIEDETDFMSLGDILQQMGELDKAEHYYYRRLDQVEDNNPNISRCYYGLGNIALKRADYDTSLNNFNKAIDLELKSSSVDYCWIGDAYNGLGIVYRHKQNADLALENYYKALEAKFKDGCHDYLSTAMIYNNIGIIHNTKDEYDLALKSHNECLRIKMKLLPDLHPSMAPTLNNIGNVYSRKQEFDQALVQYQKVLKIQLVSLPTNHPQVANTYNNIGEVYKHTKQYDLAAKHYLTALEIYEKSFPSNYPEIIRTKNNIRDLYDKLTSI
ncbi:unnamed protein product [Didymodactylos carnosus]|uniref:Multifunctional fusion protein n=1 Tax=Didymodactylos carnosus TaxID=1234261 RepID=A0A814U0D3_9BILA|nr:unnamed protein product [Didymodactylos carnosus]CAF3931851.1 unnamed protein product [Didymodactylos carnosus]